MRRMQRSALLGAVLGAALLQGGCATRSQLPDPPPLMDPPEQAQQSQEALKPWQRGTLAKSEMAWDPDPLLADYRRHVQFSKEAASGGASLGGGGCGCN
ncbi:MAG TPA: DUF4266 domain-containing protein [Solimonas sp.]|nr:DUF4266 domain-containing protein [Solimonas sp.]